MNKLPFGIDQRFSISSRWCHTSYDMHTQAVIQDVFGRIHSQITRYDGFKVEFLV